MKNSDSMQDLAPFFQFIDANEHYMEVIIRRQGRGFYAYLSTFAGVAHSGIDVRNQPTDTLIGALTGSGNTPEEALRDLVRKMQGKCLIYPTKLESGATAYASSRVLIPVPKLLFTPRRRSS